MVSPKDIGFIRLGQPSRVKLTAYDYSIYGAMPGTVVQVGADAVGNERGESFYLVRVQTEKKAIESLGSALPIISGMQAQVDIITGSKTVLRYLLKPLIAVQENAFRER
jgi:membrane fusion protein, adhesin transport system